MADSVYYHLERMLPELDDLKERGLFSDAEIKEIVRRRREFEFRLERRSKVKEDYLNYIQYETQLEKLRLLRKKGLVRELQFSKRRWQPSLCDRASAMRVMLIYERAITRFKGDLDLWMQYLEYCKSQGTRRMQKVLTKILRLHPTVPGVWIYASAWEFEHNANITAARALMHRGLRVCPQSEQLWLEYFRMELIYAERLKADDFHPAIDTEDLQMGFNREEDNDEDDDDLVLRLDNADIFEGVHAVPRGNKAGMSAIQIDELAYNLACTIYRNAVAALPSSPIFRRKFIESLQKANFHQASSLQDEIFSSVERDFPLDAGCWDWQARFRFQATGDRQNAIKVYENALCVTSSFDMYERYAQFLKEISGLQHQSFEHLSVTLEQSEEGRVLVATHLQSLYSRAKACGVLSAGLVQDHAVVLLQLGKLDLARKLLEEFCMGQFSNCTRLWAMRIMIEMRVSVRDSCSSKVADLFQQGLNQIAISEAGELWALVQESFAGHAIIYDRIIDSMISKLAGSIGDKVSALLACSLIDWIFCSQDIKHARSVYERILALPGSSIHIYKHCIKLESWMAAMGCKDAPKYMRSLFESAASKYSQHAELWLDYCSVEMKAGNLDAAGNIYWRAKKILQNPSAFIEEHQRLQGMERSEVTVA